MNLSECLTHLANNYLEFFSSNDKLHLCGFISQIGRIKLYLTLVVVVVVAASLNVVVITEAVAKFC